MNDEHLYRIDPINDLPATTIARGTFLLSLAALIPTLPLLWMRNVPDWLAVMCVSFAVPAAFAAVVSGIEYLLRRRRHLAV
jgi:phosphatidylglycerophosphate synthase